MQPSEEPAQSTRHKRNLMLTGFLLAGLALSPMAYTTINAAPESETRNSALADPSMQSALQAGRLRNFSEMARLLLPLAESGNAEACFRLAGLYRSGRGVANNANQAAHWALQAARQGHAGARSLLASLCQRGNACSDNVKALLEQAARDGFQPAQERLEALQKTGNSGVDNDDLLSLIQRGHLKPLQALAQSNKEQLQTALLIQDQQGRTPLMLAIENEHAELASWLLENFSGETLQLTVADQQHDSALTLALLQNLSLASGLVPALLQSGADVRHANQQGDTPLLLALGLVLRTSSEEASQHGQVLNQAVAVVKTLLDGGADPNQPNHNQQSPLLLIERAGLIAPLTQSLKHALLSAGAAPITASSKPVASMMAKDEQGLYEGWPELAVAAWQGEEARVKGLLQQGVDINATGPDGLTPLARAAWRGHPGIVELLVRQGADVSIQDKRGRNVLMWALQAPQPNQILPALMASREATRALQQVDQNDATVLLQAAALGNTAVLKQLLTAGADVGSTDSNGQNALQIAIQHQQADAVAVLLEFGGNPAHQDNNGRNALWYAADGFAMDAKLASRTSSDTSELMTSGKILARILKSRQSALMVADNQGHRAAERCVIRQSLSCMTLLTTHSGEKIHPNHLSKGKTTLLMLAASTGQIRLVRHVLAFKPKLDLRNLEGNSALMLAAQQGHGNVVERLLKAGANPLPRNRQKLDAAGLAEQRGHMEVAQLIREDAAAQNPLWKILGG